METFMTIILPIVITLSAVFALIWVLTTPPPKTTQPRIEPVISKGGSDEAKKSYCTRQLTKYELLLLKDYYDDLRLKGKSLKKNYQYLNDLFCVNKSSRTYYHILKNFDKYYEKAD